MEFQNARRWWVIVSLAALVGGCEGLPFGAVGGTAEEAPVPASVRLVERDVEVPEVFQVADEGLWDGRPSLGGVWVAHPDVKEPERVIIRNLADGAFVIGALFHRERVGTGPALQVSSDAAEALGMVAGQPQRIEVTALRRESVPETPVAQEPAEELPAEADAETARPADTDPGTEPAAETGGAGDGEGDGTEPEIITTPLAAAEAAIARSEEAEAATRAATAPPPAPDRSSRATPRPSSLDRAFIQIGFFSLRENAESTGARLRSNGILPAIREHSANDKTYWRVVVGPASNQSERAELLAQIREMGFADAYFVAD